MHVARRMQIDPSQQRAVLFFVHAAQQMFRRLDFFVNASGNFHKSLPKASQNFHDWRKSSSVFLYGCVCTYCFCAKSNI